MVSHIFIDTYIKKKKKKYLVWYADIINVCTQLQYLLMRKSLIHVLFIAERICCEFIYKCLIFSHVSLFVCIFILYKINKNVLSFNFQFHLKNWRLIFNINFLRQNLRRKNYCTLINFVPSVAFRFRVGKIITIII